MRIVEIVALENGAHRNQTMDAPLAILDGCSIVPDGWALIPDDMETENFPFGEVTAEETGGVMTVISWTPGTIPEPEPAPVLPPSNEELAAENKLLKEQVAALSDQNEFQEELIVELANIVYA